MLAIKNFTITPILVYRFVLLLGIIFSIYNSEYVVGLYTFLQALMGSIVITFILTYSKNDLKEQKEEFILFSIAEKNKKRGFKKLLSLGGLFLFNVIMWLVILGNVWSLNY